MIWYLLSLVIVVIDQGTKYFFSTQTFNDPYQVLPFLSFSHLCNSGAAFGFFAGMRWPLVAVGVIFVGYFSWEISKENRREPRHLTLLLGYSLILAGALGNLIDRSLQGCVVDFIFLHYAQYGFPVFNVADIGISCGAALWIWSLLRGHPVKQSLES